MVHGPFILEPCGVCHKTSRQDSVPLDRTRKRSEPKYEEETDQEVTTEQVLADASNHSAGLMPDLGANLEEALTSTSNVYNEIVIDPGETVTVAVGEESKLKAVHIKYIGFGNETDVTGIQNKLCSALEVCATDGTGKVKQKELQTDPDLELLFLEFVFPENATGLFDTDDVDFSVEIHTKDGKVLIRRYDVDMAPKIQTRIKHYKSWSSFSYYSIPDEYLFPDYTQHIYGKCYVGCGPVAWAMVFGYLDRRSHCVSLQHGTGSQGLYRNGPDGTYGLNSQVAPCRSDTRMEPYIENLNRIMGTYCSDSGGATKLRRMDDVLSFYKARQTGKPRVVLDKWVLSFLGMYHESIASWTRARVREGWPVIIGTKKTWFSGFHAPVVTKYRRRSRRYRRCLYKTKKGKWILCGKWKTQYDNDMYLHQGWGGSRNGWYPMKSFFSIAAKY